MIFSCWVILEAEVWRLVCLPTHTSSLYCTVHIDFGNYLLYSGSVLICYCFLFQNQKWAFIHGVCLRRQISSNVHQDLKTAIKHLLVLAKAPFAFKMMIFDYLASHEYLRARALSIAFLLLSCRIYQSHERSRPQIYDRTVPHDESSQS